VQVEEHDIGLVARRDLSDLFFQAERAGAAFGSRAQ
jgi:hypothetical protein